jgi:hypothetical protein cfetvA_16920
MKQITKLPQPPTTAEPQNFDDRADAFVGALPAFVTETNELAAEVEESLQTVRTLKENADASKQAAQTSAQAASEAKEAAARSANEAESSAQAASEAKTAAATSAKEAKERAQAVAETKEELSGSLGALEEMKKIVATGFIDDTQTRTNLTYSSKKIDSDFSKADHNHDTTYLSIEKFNEFKTKVVKKQNNLDFMVNFLQDVTADGVAVKIDDTSGSVNSFVASGLPILSVDNGKYFYIDAIGSKWGIISEEIKNPNSKNIFKRGDLFPYPDITVAFLFKIGDLLYFSRQSQPYIYNTKTNQMEINYSGAGSFDQMDQIRYIDPKFPITRHSGKTLKILDTDGYIELEDQTGTIVVIQNYIIQMNYYTKSVKAFKITVNGRSASIAPIDMSEVPYHGLYKRMVNETVWWRPSIRDQYYKKGSDLYYLENFENDDGISRSYALYKNKERLPIPIMPQRNEKLFLAQRTRFLINVYIGTDQTYTRMYDITGKGKIVRLPVGVLCAEETEQGIRIAYVTRLPADGKPRTFYEAVLPYGIFNNEE